MGSVSPGDEEPWHGPGALQSAPPERIVEQQVGRANRKAEHDHLRNNNKGYRWSGGDDGGWGAWACALAGCFVPCVHETRLSGSPDTG